MTWLQGLTPAAMEQKEWPESLAGDPGRVGEARTVNLDDSPACHISVSVHN